MQAVASCELVTFLVKLLGYRPTLNLFIYELFINYNYYRQNAYLRLEACVGIFSSNEKEMPPQIKFPTSNNLLKDPLLTVEC